MAEEAKGAGAKSNNPKPIPKPGSLKTPTSVGGKKGIKDYKSLTGRQKPPYSSYRSAATFPPKS